MSDAHWAADYLEGAGSDVKRVMNRRVPWWQTPRRSAFLAAWKEVGVYIGVLGAAALAAFPYGWRAAAVVGIGGVGLAIRRRWPLIAIALPVTIITWANSSLILLLALSYGAGYRIDRRDHLLRWLSGFLLAASAAIVSSIWLNVQDVWSGNAGRWTQAGIAILIGLLVGQVQAQRHALHAAWRERAERADRDRAIAAERAGLRERARIARDMHDALGHQLTLISLQVAALEVDSDLSAGQRTAVQTLGRSVRTAIDELRSVVGALRSDDDPDEFLPNRDIHRLIEQAKASGMDVTLIRHSDPPPVSTIIHHTLYRVVQEALTNAHKHAPGSPASVELTYESGSVIVEVRNRRSSAEMSPARRPEDTGPGGGQGLMGLRERVSAVGGLLRAGPNGHDYRVLALLPLEVVATQPEMETLSRTETGSASHDRQAETAAPEPRIGKGTSAGVALLLCLSAVISAATSSAHLSEELYQTIEVGQSAQEVYERLPRHFLVAGRGTGTKERIEPWCVSYHGTRATDWGSRSDRRYRLCFSQGVLTEKQELER